MQSLFNNVASALYLLVSVPVRILDFGGWLDTWLAVYGLVINFAVRSRLFGASESKFRGVDVLVSRLETISNPMIHIVAGDLRFDIDVPVSEVYHGSTICRKNLIIATLAMADLGEVLGHEHGLEIRIMSPIPPGASMGTSAAVAVAVLEGINEIRRAMELVPWAPEEIRLKAWQAEVDERLLGMQSGIQDQIASAFRFPVNRIKMDEYPQAAVTEIPVSASFVTELESCLVTVVVGEHSSSDTHVIAIGVLESEGPESTRLRVLREAVLEAEAAILGRDLVALGAAMIKNTEGQRGIHPDLVGERHQQVIDLAVRFGYLGYKVNGAGGAGGSVSLLFVSRTEAEKFYQSVSVLYPEFDCFEHQLV